MSSGIIILSQNCRTENELQRWAKRWFIFWLWWNWFVLSNNQSWIREIVFCDGVIQFRMLSQHIDISPLVKSIFNHLEQGSEHKNCITAHVFFFCVYMETAELTISLSLSPPSPSLCFDPGWEWSQWAESTDAFSQCHCGKLPFNWTEWRPVWRFSNSYRYNAGSLKAHTFWMTPRKV